MIKESWEGAEPVLLAGATRHVLTMDDEQWEITVALPPHVGSGADGATAGAPPVVYLTDPLGTFATTASVARTTILLSEAALQPMAIVGIGPHTDDLHRAGAQRFRDLTPTQAHANRLDGFAVYGVGGADRFLTMLTDIIAPHIEHHYDLDPTDRCIAGWSLGGMFACYATLTRPDAFTKCLAVSPSLYWDDQIVTRQAHHATPGSLTGKTLYLGTGEHEGKRAITWPPIPPDRLHTTPDLDMIGHAQAFAHAARRLGAHVHQETITDEHHITAWAAGITRGLLTLYRTDRPHDTHAHQPSTTPHASHRP